jgi:hypothetical protein
MRSGDHKPLSTAGRGLANTTECPFGRAFQGHELTEVGARNGGSVRLAQTEGR